MKNTIKRQFNYNPVGVLLGISFLLILLLSFSAKQIPISVKPLSNGPKHHFFGYYGINPWDKSGRYHLALETDFDDRRPESNDVAKVGVIDKQTSEFIPIAETSAFNFQQGSMMHWIDAGFGEEFTYNGYYNNMLISYAVNFRTKEKRRINGAIAAVSPNQKEGIGLNFVRMSFCRAVVGYAHDREDYKLVNIPNDDGLYSLNFETGKSELIVSIKEVIDKSDYDLPKNKPAWFNHVLYNPSGERMFFFCRIQRQDGRGFLTSLWTVNKDGSDLQNQVPFGNKVSHFDWKDDNTILITTNILGEMEYVEFTDGKKNFKVIGRGILTVDGHCSYSPDKKWILSDTYPRGAERLTEVFLYNIERNEKNSLGKFRHDEIYKGIIRCDLHPRFSNDGKTVTFDSVHDGTRQIYSVDVSNMVK